MNAHRYGWMTLVALLALLAPATLLAQGKILEAVDVPDRADWTPECTTWHELYPNFCMTHHQTGHEDNGDGEISSCDVLVLDDLRWHIDWVGPTYWLDCNGDGVEDFAYEPLQWWPGDPVCQDWVQVWPQYGEVFHVDGWEDGNGNGVVDECDFIRIGPMFCHVMRVGLNVHLTEDPTPTQESTWGKVKSFFGGLF